MIEKLALLRIAFCKAPVLSNASLRRTSVIASTAGLLPLGAPTDGMLILLLPVLPLLRPGRLHHGCRARGSSRSVLLQGPSSPRSSARRWPRSSRFGRAPGDRRCRHRASPPAALPGSSASPPRSAGPAAPPSRRAGYLLQEAPVGPWSVRAAAHARRPWEPGSDFRTPCRRTWRPAPRWPSAVRGEAWRGQWGRRPRTLRRRG